MADRLEGKLSDDLARKFAFDRPSGKVDGSRIKLLTRKILEEASLGSVQDLLVPVPVDNVNEQRV